MASIKITQLSDIGNNIAANTLVPVVDMSGSPVTDKANLQIIGNLILTGAGGANFAPAAKVNISNTSSNSQLLFNNTGNIAGTANLTINLVTGAVTTPGNVSALGTRFNLGANAGTIPLNAPTLVATANNAHYVQASIFNLNTTGSSDLITYGAESNDDQGWNDLGFTSQGFNDANYSITGPGDGYIFCQTYTGNTFNGNLVIATGENSVSGDIIFATGGFTSGQDKARITGTGKLLVGYSTSQDTSNLQVNGNITSTGIRTPNIYSADTVFLGTGGNTTAGWVYGTDGVLTWPSDYGDWKIGNSNGAFEMSSTTSVTIHTDLGNLGAHFTFDQDGVFHAPGNIQMHGQRLSVGAGAESIALVSPTIVAATSSNTFVQGCIFNFDSDGSADLATTGAAGTDEDAWTDMGFTGHTFNDPAYTITGPGDGYIFVQSYANVAYGGNLVLATGENSANGDIIFATGGFTAGQDKVRITGAGKLLVGYSVPVDNALVQINGQVSAGVVKTGVYTTGTIPTAAAAGAGARAFVTDATSTTFAAAYVGGGANAVPVYSDGTSWYIG